MDETVVQTIKAALLKEIDKNTALESKLSQSVDENKKLRECVEFYAKYSAPTNKAILCLKQIKELK